MTKYRVLIVEDDQDMQTILKGFIKDEYEVVVAGNGLDALLNIRRIEPDMILLDVMMPVMDGLEFVKRVRHHPFDLKIPIIMLSAMTEHHEIAQGKRLGADAYLTKPIEMQRLQRVMKTQLIEHRLPHVKKKLSLEELEKVLAAQDSLGTFHKEGSTNGHEVLLVSGEDEIRNSIAEELGKSQKVYSAVNGLEAIDKMISQPFDFFIIDYQLPKVSGIEFASLLRRTGVHQETPIVFLLDKKTEHELDQIEEFGRSRYVVKPVDHDELVSLMNPQKF